MDSKTLEARQRWTLSQKIDHTLGTIDTFVSRLGGLDKVYCSFSGGKDAVVLFYED
jgi:predicted phosphoadenosine phosphosulfate sulfurtransferase